MGWKTWQLKVRKQVFLENVYYSVYSSYEINIFLFFCGGLQFKPTKRVSFFLKQEGSACQQFQSTRLLEFISCDHPIKKLHSPKLTFSPLKMENWKIYFPYGFRPIFRSQTTSFREGRKFTGSDFSPCHGATPSARSSVCRTSRATFP